MNQVVNTPTREFYGPTISCNFLISFLKACAISLVLTLCVAYLAFMKEDFVVSNWWLSTVCIAHFLALVLPVDYAIRTYRSRRDVFDPAFISSLSFILNNMVFNLLVLGSMEALQSRNLYDVHTDEFAGTIVLSYAVTFVSWCSFIIGFLYGCKLLPADRRKTDGVNGKTTITPLYLFVGLSFILIGILGNIGAMGSVSSYLSKTVNFYERSIIYEEIMEVSGSMKLDIAMRFLPIGLVLLGLGYALSRNIAGKGMNFLLILLAGMNILLNSATGQRSSTLSAFFLSGILMNYSTKRFKFQTLILGIAGTASISFVLGGLRDAAYFGINPFIYITDGLFPYFEHFATHYMTNYLGTLTLVNEVNTTGIVYGQTAFAGLTGLLGGPTPLTTQAEIFYRITGEYKTINPRYGPPGELFFNFGWIGVVIGMMFIGLLVAFFAIQYRKQNYELTVSNGFFAIFVAITSWFIMIANLSYVPPHFTYYAVPYYLIFFAFRRRKC